MKKTLMWIFAISLIIVLNNPQWLKVIDLSFINMKAITSNLAWIWLYITIIAIIAIYFMFDKEYKVDKNNKNEEFGYEVAPYLVEFLNIKYLSYKSFASCIYSLIKKGVFIPIVIEKNSKVEYMFILNKDYDFEELSKEEQTLKNFLISQIGNNDYWTLNAYETIAFSNRSASYFNNIYNNWKDIHNTLAVKNNIFERLPEKFYNNVLHISFVGFFLSILVFFYKSDFYVGYYLLAAAIGFIFYVFAFTRLNINFVNIKFYYNTIKARIRLMNSRDKYNIKDANEWEEYLLYSIVLNESNKVEQLVSEIVKENNDDFDSYLFKLSKTKFLKKFLKITNRNVLLGNLSNIIPVGVFSAFKITTYTDETAIIFEQYEELRTKSDSREENVEELEEQEILW